MLQVSDAELDDLRSRITNTRWAREWPLEEWEGGTNAAELRRLADYWASGYDWRAQERAINALPSHFADINGTPVHYLRFDAETPGALPIVLTHGWPSTFFELVELGRRLATPSLFGGEASDAFTVIIPSLPGFTVSPQRATRVDSRRADGLPTHELWHRLMHDELGFERYAAHGGDFGAGISSHIGEAHPESVVGIHVLMVRGPVDVDPASITDEEQAYLDEEAQWEAQEGGYEHLQATRPVTLGYGLSDSPVGLLAWILEKFRAWSDGAGDGKGARADMAATFTDDFVLTQASLYWFTNSISTSLRPYFEYPAVTPIQKVTVPTAVAIFPADLVHPPRSWAERTYNVMRYTQMPRGGHFAAKEQPELLAADITEFFRPLR